MGMMHCFGNTLDAVKPTKPCCKFTQNNDGQALQF